MCPWDLSPRVVALLRERGFDATGAHAVGQAGRSDLEQLRYAAQDGRCLITRNVTDFLELIRSLINRQESHAGIILVPASFRGDEFALLADAIAQSVATFPQGLADLVLFLKRTGGSFVTRPSSAPTSRVEFCPRGQTARPEARTRHC